MSTSQPGVPALQTSRVYFLDYLRVIACFLVLMVHASEQFFGPEGNIILSGSHRLWIGLWDGFARISVPLFMICSAYLLLPMKEGQSWGDVLQAPFPQGGAADADIHGALFTLSRHCRYVFVAGGVERTGQNTAEFPGSRRASVVYVSFAGHVSSDTCPVSLAEDCNCTPGKSIHLHLACHYQHSVSQQMAWRRLGAVLVEQL